MGARHASTQLGVAVVACAAGTNAPASTKAAAPTITRVLDIVRSFLGGRADLPVVAGAGVASVADRCRRGVGRTGDGRGRRARPEPGETAASKAEVDRELHEARRRADVERTAASRTRRLAVGLAAALVLALVAATGATWFQRQASDRATEAATVSNEADANRLAALSTSVRSLDRSLLLAAQARRIADTPATRDGLLTTLLAHDRAWHVLQLTGRPSSAALADDGRMLFLNLPLEVLAWPVGSDEDPKVVLRWGRKYGIIAASPTEDLFAAWSLKDDDTNRIGVFDSGGRRRLLLDDLPYADEQPRGLAFSRDGRSLYVTMLDYSVPDLIRSYLREYDLRTGRLVRSKLFDRSTAGAWLQSALSGNGRTALSWVMDGSGPATMLNVRSGRRARLRVVDRPSEVQSFFPLDDGAAAAWQDGALTLYDEAGRTTQVLQAHRGVVTDLAVSPDRSWAVTADNAGAVLVWEVDPATGTWSRPSPLTGHDGALVALAVSPDGHDLVTVGEDRAVVDWDMTSAAGLAHPLPGLGDSWMSNRPAEVVPGELLVAPTRRAPGKLDWWEQDRSNVFATFIDPRTERVVDRVFAGRSMGYIFGSSVSVSPDRSMVAVTYGFGTVVLDAQTHEEVARIVLDDAQFFGEQKPEAVWCSAWTPDGDRLLLCADGDQFNFTDGGLVVVDTTTWQPAAKRVDIGGAAQTLEFSPDGSLLAAGLTQPDADDPRER